MARTLPDHMYIGRGTVSGPAIGPYVTFQGTQIDIAAADAANRIAWAVELPAEFRVERIDWHSPNAASAAGVTLEFTKNTTLSVTGDVALVTAVIDLNTASSGYAEIAAGGTTTLVKTARNIGKGEFLMAVTNDHGQTLLDLNVQVTGFFMGHFTALPEDD